MILSTTTRTTLTGIGLASLLATFGAHAGELITNGGFETGDFTAWSVYEAGTTGAVSVASGFVAPNSLKPTAGPASGNYYALMDDPFTSANALIQTFSTGPVQSAVLSFNMFVNDHNPSGQVFIDPSGLDATTGGSFSPNQHARVDLLTASASPFDTGAGVLKTFYLGGGTGRSFNNPYTGFDVTDVLAMGGTFQLRFAEVNNQDFFNVGVDNVSLQVTPVPEASTWAMMLAGLALTGLITHRRRHPLK